MLELENLPPISIMTPNLNRGSYIAEAIDSVQTRNCPAVGHITLDVGAARRREQDVPNDDHENRQRRERKQAVQNTTQTLGSSFDPVGRDQEGEP